MFSFVHVHIRKLASNKVRRGEENAETFQGNLIEGGDGRRCHVTGGRAGWVQPTLAVRYLLPLAPRLRGTLQSCWRCTFDVIKKESRKLSRTVLDLHNKPYRRSGAERNGIIMQTWFLLYNCCNNLIYNLINIDMQYLSPHIPFYKILNLVKKFWLLPKQMFE